jgi:release factor glutamine methyltransferase
MSAEGKVREILEAAGIGGAAMEARRIVAATGVGGDAEALELARQRVAGRPLAYVIGTQRFMGVDLHVDPGALVPRAETELLGRTCVRVLRETDGKRAIDLCCGSGNLACAIASELPGMAFWACDLTDGCVRLARHNVHKLGLEARVKVHQGDLFAALAGLGLEGTIDAVVCNPPYISSGRLAKDRSTLLEHEPREAFDGGPFGLTIHQRVVKEALAYLRPGGWLLFEIGLGQHKQVKILFDRTRAYGEVQVECDAEGNPRVAYARRLPQLDAQT